MTSIYSKIGEELATQLAQVIEAVPESNKHENAMTRK